MRRVMDREEILQAFEAFRRNITREVRIHERSASAEVIESFQTQMNGRLRQLNLDRDTSRAIQEALAEVADALRRSLGDMDDEE